MKSQLYFFVASYYRFFARLVLARWHPSIIAVTGSAGKTSTLYLLQKVLATSYTVAFSKKANSAFGVPLNILGITAHDYSNKEMAVMIFQAPFACLRRMIHPPTEKLYVVELDSDRPGEIEFFTRFIKPQAIVWISSSATHTEQFSRLVKQGLYRDEIDAVAAEYATLLLSSMQTALCMVYNQDSGPINAIMHEHAVPTLIPIGIHAPVWKILSWEVKRKRTVIELQLHDGSVTAFDVPSVVPRTFAYSLLAICVIAHHYKIGEDMIQKVLEEFHLPPGRSTVFEGVHNSMVIDSSYNSSLEAVLGLLELLEAMPGKRKIAVLGDMRELGAQTKDEHERLADVIIQRQIKEVVLVGPSMKAYVGPRLLELGFEKEHMNIFDNSYHAGMYVKESLLREGDVVLVKASQNTLFFEIIVELLLANADDKQHLCRREPVWESKRNVIKKEFYDRVHATS
ncbi:MAG: Mur ligase family protein [Candidatus Roizmanbacteria bacterium]|nr:Mur ligase family protein [Candidatus Roizmanbacteria bacterium]